MSRSVQSRGSAPQGNATGRAPQELAPALALGAWTAALVEGRRVAVVGDTSSGIAEQLADAARRRVHAYDPDPARAASSIARNRTRGGEVSFAPLDEAIDTRQGAFDAVVVPDLAELPDDTLADVQNLLSARGILVVASANTAHPLAAGRNGLGYYELYDLFSDHFDHLHMLGQAPFTGYTVADFAAEGDPAITVDGSLMPTAEEPLWFIAVASAEPLHVDPYTLLQLPLASCQAQLGLHAGPATDTAALAEARLQSSAVTAELDKLRDDQRELGRLAEERKQSATALSVQVTELRSELSETRRAVEQKQRELAKQSDVLNARTRETAKLHDDLSRVQRQLEQERKRRDADRNEAEEAFQEELDRMLERIAELEGAEEQETPTERAPLDAPDASSVRGFEFQIDELKKALASARGELSAAEARATQAGELQARVQELEQRAASAVSGDGEGTRQHAEDIDALEAHLAERATTVEQLRQELREAERVGRELVRELESARASNAEHGGTLPTHGLDGQHQALQHKCARLEADLQAAQWELAALTQQLDDRLGATPSSDDHAALEEALREARQQLAELRASPAGDAQMPGKSDD